MHEILVFISRYGPEEEWLGGEENTITVFGDCKMNCTGPVLSENAWAELGFQLTGLDWEVVAIDGNVEDGAGY